jgi:serine/threonine protein kinase
MESGSLSDVLKVSGALSESLIAEICIQVLRGLLYLHSDRRIIHRYRTLFHTLFFPNNRLSDCWCVSLVQ